MSGCSVAIGVQGQRTGGTHKVLPVHLEQVQNLRAVPVHAVFHGHECAHLGREG